MISKRTKNVARKSKSEKIVDKTTIGEFISGSES